MALTAGTKLGPYEIQSPLGAGGMGEVYRARDTRLERTVAVKILPANFSADAERLRQTTFRLPLRLKNAKPCHSEESRRCRDDEESAFSLTVSPKADPSLRSG